MPPLSKIWSHFTKLGHEATYKQERAQCNYCSHKLLAAANRCEQHLKKCTKVSHHVLNEYFQQNQNIITQSSQSENSISSTSSTSSSFSSSLSQATPLVNTSIINFIDRISSAEQQEFEILFATAIFRCGLHFSFAELKPIHDIFYSIRPALKLPSRKKLSTDLLKHVFETTKNQVTELINSAESLCLICDGWYIFYLFFLYF